MDESLLSEKQRERCKQFKGDQSHFFFGDVAGPPVEAVDPSGFKDVRSRRPWSLQKLFEACSGPANPSDAFHVELLKKRIAERAKRTKTAGTALGIPDRQAYGDLSKVKPGELLDYIVQHHLARRAGPHYDVRFGSPQTGLYSWAVRKGLPGPGGKHPGGKHLAAQQPVHEPA
jgi:hypothetical protein